MYRDAGPIFSATASVNATTSCFVRRSISSIRGTSAAMSNVALALISATASFGTTPSSAQASQARTSSFSQSENRLAGSQMAAIFGRAGTTLVASTAFIVVLSSYSSIGVSAGSLLWIVVAAPLTTLLLGAAPGKGATTALMTLCALYGRGFENGYLLAAPVSLPLVAMGAFLDALWAGCAALLVSRKEGHALEKESRFYI